MYCLISLMLILSACTGSIKFHVAGTLSDIVDETEDVSLIVPPPLYTPSSNGPSAPSNYMLEMPKNLTGPMGPT